jgi:hypothetical protein
LLRYGLSDGFELRLGVPGLEIDATDSATGDSQESGLVDATVGFKVAIAEGQGAVPQVTFVGTLWVPSGDDEFSSGRIDPALLFALSHALGERFGLTYNLGMSWVTERDAAGPPDTRSYLDWAVTAGYAASDRVGAFVELFGVTGVSAQIRPISSTGGGVTYLVTPRLQIDGRLTVGLSQAALDWSAGIGVSYRFPRSKG